MMMGLVSSSNKICREDVLMQVLTPVVFFVTGFIELIMNARKPPASRC